MAIQNSEIVYRNPVTVSNDSSNGGRPDMTALSPSGQDNNTWDNVLTDERENGSTTKRKKFAHVMNSEDKSLLNAKAFLHKPTSADDYVKWYPGTMRNTEGDLTGSERPYGVAVLKTSVSSGNTLVVTIEGAAETDLFQDNDEIVVTTKANPTDVAGIRKYFTLNGSPVQVGDELTLTTDQAIEDSLVAGSCYIATAHSIGTLSTSFDNWVRTSSAGTYDESTYPPILTNLGCIEQTWTIEFINATTYSVTGDTVGALANGSTASDYAPNNPLESSPYFTLESAGFGGTFASGDTIVFQTHPIMFPFWQDRVVPALSDSFSANEVVMVVVGESN